jgi:predicted Zn finger-like uncharacterized protein
MYTQCPECDVAFRVTAEVLRQAAGKVRCGGCGIAFNALEHLSEEKPQAPVRKEPEPQVPELTPEPPPELEADTPPQSISAEQSAALLKTLDQLAGSDIRIEDTGIEWRVLDVDPEAEPEPEEEAVADSTTDTGSLKFFIEDESDESEIVEEMRFDDDTPLPDDFDSDEAPVSIAEPEPVVVEEAPATDDLEDAQVDLVFGEADEWEDLLGDIDETGPEEASEQDLDIEDEDEEETPEEADDLIVLGSTESDDSADQPLDMDTQFAIQAEAMGIDLSGLHDVAGDDENEDEPDDVEEYPDVDEDEPETSIDDDLIAAAFETEAAREVAEDIEEELEEELEEDPDDEIEEEPEEELEEDLDEEVEAELDNEIEEEIEEDVEEELEDELEEEPAAEIDEDEPGDTDASDEHFVPEMSEEELTINMMIDQELLSVAVEDEDGFASTIVQKQPDKKVEKEIGDKKKKEKAAPLFETIVMEGESVHGDRDREKLARDRAAQNKKSALQSMVSKRASDQSERREHNRPSIGMLAGAAVLVLLLP